MNVAVIGVGNMGKNHVRVYAKLTNLVAVSDINEELGKELASKYKCKFYKYYKEMLEKEKLDAVSIAVPTSLHKQVALDVIKHGVNLLVEKPLTNNLEDSEFILEEAKKAQVKLMVGHVERFNPAVKKLKELIDNNELGKINTIVVRRVGVAGDPRKYEDIILDLALHDIDILNYLLDAFPKKSFCLKGNSFSKHIEDYADILLHYGNTNAFLQVNWITPLKIRTLNITGTKGYAELNYITQDLKLFKTNYHKDYDSFGDFVMKFGATSEVAVDVQKAEPLELELKSFLRAISENKNFDVTAREAIDALRIALEVTKNPIN